MTDRADDASTEELARGSVIALDRHPLFMAARTLAEDSLGPRIRQVEADLGGENLRRLWKADLRSWRQKADDHEMARLTLGYLAAWRGILEGGAPVAGLWGEDGGHLCKRIPFLLGTHGLARVWYVQIGLSRVTFPRLI